MVHCEIHPVNPQRRFLERAVSILKHHHGICVYPTDTVYGMGACASASKAIEKIGKLLQKDSSRLFSFICSDFSQMSRYARIDNNNFKLMRRYLPGPYTFILPATNVVPKKIRPKRKTVGVRLPDCPVCIELVNLLGEPLANTSIAIPGRLRGDPKEVRPAVLNEVDIMLDAGMLEEPFASTIVDLTGEEPVVLREGKGEWR
ncbi:MAG: threonylcarbamoyl-AMP synthase [Chitinivibrionales bacterium]|nr:threonylcarbamoyl-AMP synthase [Chitinivibrionales bacterium]MBD3355935.1 threonylcarbamoyl-AMP synthase [Chitinivibrionales bacterium]